MSYSTVGNIPDIFEGTSIGNGYEKIMERTGRYETVIGLFHAGPCVSDAGRYGASNARQSFPVNGPSSCNWNISRLLFHLSMNVRVLTRPSFARPLITLATSVHYSGASLLPGAMLTLFEACLYTRHAYSIDTHV